MAFCPKCGNQLNPDAQTCPSCGADIGQAAAAAPPPAPETPPLATDASTSPPPPPGAAFAPPPPSGPYAPPPSGPAFGPPPGAGPMPPGQAWPAPVMMKKKTSGMAIASLILGITGFVCLPILGPILGIIFGLMAKSQIKRDGGQVEGGGLATAGIAISVIAIVLLLAVGIPVGIMVYNTVAGPMDTTNDFIAYVKEGNASAAYGLLAPNTATRSEIEDFVTDHKGTPKEYFAFSTNVTNNRAEVTVRFTDRDGYETEKEFELRKDDGDWQITYVPDW